MAMGVTSKGRLKKGYRYGKGGRVVKAKAKAKSKAKRRTSKRGSRKGSAASMQRWFGKP